MRHVCCRPFLSRLDGGHFPYGLARLARVDVVALYYNRYIASQEQIDIVVFTAFCNELFALAEFDNLPAFGELISQIIISADQLLALEGVDKILMPISLKSFSHYLSPIQSGVNATMTTRATTKIDAKNILNKRNSST